MSGFDSGICCTKEASSAARAPREQFVFFVSAARLGFHGLGGLTFSGLAV